MFKKLSLRLKLILVFLPIALITVAVNYYQITSTQQFRGTFSDLTTQDFNRLYALENMELSSVKLRDQRLEYQQDVTVGDVKKIASQQAIVGAQVDDFQNAIQTYLAFVKAANPNVPLQTIDAITSASKVEIDNTLLTINSKGTTQTQNSLRISQTKVDETITTAIGLEREGITGEAATVSKSIDFLLTTIAALAIVTTLFTVVLCVSVAAWLARSLAKMRVGADRIANGDFSQTISVTSQDEIGQLAMTFNRMAERMKDSYRRLALERQRDDATLQSMNEGLIALDEKGKVIVINPVAMQMLGFQDEDAAVGKPIQEVLKLYDANDKDNKPLSAKERPSHRALEEGEAVNGIYGFTTGLKERHLMNIEASPVALDGKTVGVVTIMRDVTKEREVDRMKTEFISLASHQLRTPLSAIKWFSEMLVAGDAGVLKPDQMDFAKNIADSTQRMIELVNSLLNISRIESGRIMVDPKPTDLRELVGGIVTDLKGKTEEKKQTLIISVHEGLAKINLDPRLIGQVYLNLLTNAVKYTPPGGEISVFISRKGDQIISQVADNGYGIPKDQQARVFQKFFRAANAVKVETDGTGLGLYLIKAIIESSGGKIWFESAEGEGTSFWFSIPASGMKAKEGEVTLDG